MKNRSLLYPFLIVGIALVLPHFLHAQVVSPLLKAIVHNGQVTLQVSSAAAVDSLFARDTSNQVALDFYFTPNDLRNGFHTAQPSIQLQGDVYLSFQGFPWQVNDALTFSVAQYGPDGGIVRGYTFVNGDYTGPDGAAPSICPTSIACNNLSGLTMTFPPQYLVQKVRTLSLSLSFGPDNPYNGIYQTNGVDVATNAVYVDGNFNCNQILTGSAMIIFDGLVCQYEGGQLVSPPCSPFGGYYTPGDVCAEYFENCAKNILTPLMNQSSELPCRQWKEKSPSTCGTSTYIYRPGKVSIGTSKQAPNSAVGAGKASLSVKNGVITDKVKVKLCDATWCDYVFDPNYPLRSLPETEAYIRQNCHLPGMPSGGDIEAEGAFELGDITRLQQEKIEEIYLHLIALQKEVELLEFELVLLEWRKQSITK